MLSDSLQKAANVAEAIAVRLATDPNNRFGAIEESIQAAQELKAHLMMLRDEVMGGW